MPKSYVFCSKCYGPVPNIVRHWREEHQGIPKSNVPHCPYCHGPLHVWRGQWRCSECAVVILNQDATVKH